MTQKAPAHLRPATRTWWKTVVDEFDLEGHHLRLLQLACENWDRACLAREALEEFGLVFIDRWEQPKPRPECAIARDATITFARLMRELDLDGAGTPEAPRPPAAPRTRGDG